MRHFVGLVGEFVRYSQVNGQWWVAGVALVLAITLVLITIGQAAAPFTLYTMF